MTTRKATAKATATATAKTTATATAKTTATQISLAGMGEGVEEKEGDERERWKLREGAVG
jgi:hypothetical protein